jgi:hypothetical protein
MNIPAEITAKFDSLLGGTLAAGAALLEKVHSQLRIRSFVIGDKRLIIEDVSYYQDGNQLPHRFKVAVQKRSQRGTGEAFGEHETMTAYFEVDPESGDIAAVMDGSARDERGDLELEEADEALCGELFAVLRAAASHSFAIKSEPQLA